MAKTSSRHTGSRVSVGIPRLGSSIKTQSPKVVRTKLTAAVLADRVAGNIFPTRIFAVIQVHLHQLSQVIGIAKKPRMAADPAQHGRAFIMHRPVEELPAEKTVIFRRNDPLPIKALIRIKSQGA